MADEVTPELDQQGEGSNGTEPAEELSTERAEIEKRLEECLGRLEELEKAPCYPFLLSSTMDHEVVDEVYQELRAKFGSSGESLTVVTDSGGGDIHAAYNLALLLRRYGTKKLTFIVPRWAKSAATLLVCAGDRILLTPVAELGPIDPQITEFNPLENRLESILHCTSSRR